MHRKSRNAITLCDNLDVLLTFILVFPLERKFLEQFPVPFKRGAFAVWVFRLSYSPYRAEENNYYTPVQEVVIGCAGSVSAWIAWLTVSRSPFVGRNAGL